MASLTLTASACCTTTLLGRTYAGRPLGVALRMSNLEQVRNAAKADAGEEDDHSGGSADDDGEPENGILHPAYGIDPSIGPLGIHPR